MKNPLIVPAILCSLSFFACAQKNVTIQQVDDYLTQLYQAGELNGNILLADKGKIIYEKSFGVANEATQEKLNLETTFELASITKQFTAMGIVMLQKEGKLNYADPISKFIPELSFYKGVTLHHLITHTGGLPDYMDFMMAARGNKTFSVTNKDVIDYLKVHQPKKEFEPGERFDYSNTGYILLASIIERVSGQTFEEYLKRTVFTPLGMKNTFVYRSRYQPKKLTNHALGYIYSDSLKRKILPDEEGKSSFYVYLDGIYGDGMMNSTLHDLLKWDRALAGNQLLTEADKKIIFGNSTTNDSKYTDYGYGWFLQQDSVYGSIARHSGRWAGYLTFIERDLDTDKTFILLQNNEHKITEIPQVVANTVRSLLKGEPIEKKHIVPEDTLLKYAGDYTYESGKKTKIYYDLGRLWTSSDFQLKAISDTTFTVIGFRPEVTYQFFVNDKNEVEKIRIQQPEQQVDQTAYRNK